MQKLWEILAWRLVILNHDKLKMFMSLSNDKLKLFCKTCKVSVYKPGDTVNMTTGGVLMSGHLIKIANDEDPDAL